MQAAHEKLDGLDRDRVIAVIEPVLSAHGVEPVELLWRSDRRGWVLYLTVERPGTTEPGAGITLDVCSDISRDLSAALDVADVVPKSYRLEVGSPGVERALYSASDYERFAGRAAKLRLRRADAGRVSVRGILRGVDADGKVVLETDEERISVEQSRICEGQLIFDFSESLKGKASEKRSRRRARLKRASHRSK